MPSTQKHNPIQEIFKGVVSRYPLFYIMTWEEERLLAALTTISATLYKDDRPVVVWSAARGFSVGDEATEEIKDPARALAHIAAAEDDAIYLLYDLPAYLGSDPTLVRALRDLYYRLKNSNRFVFLSYPSIQLPEVLKKEVYVVDFGLPGEQEILEQIQGFVASHELGGRFPEEAVRRYAFAMKGLSLNEVRHLLLRILHDKRLRAEQVYDEIYKAKAQLLMTESCLKFMPPTFDVDQIGGLDNLKEWVLDRKGLFSQEAVKDGEPLPSGILFMGVSGCGKSMAAKVVASAWDLQLVRLDMNLVMSGAYGAPEYAFERAIRIAEDIAPLVLWIDEMENSFGYDEGPLSGGNINIFSSFLTWMQEKDPAVFVVATANRIQKLPAEVIRKGRFDQVFFLDLPSAEERKDIFRIHIRLAGPDPNKFDYDLLAAVTKNWSGAEIEQAVKAAKVDAFKEDRAFNDRDITRNVAKMVPLSKTMEEQMQALRDWSYDRATPASSQQTWQGR